LELTWEAPVSREGAGQRRPEESPKAASSIWVRLIYGAGILAVSIVAFSLLFAAGTRLFSDISPRYDLSAPAAIVWGGLILLAVVTWLVRRRNRS
jgi:predicted metal-binding membrane protein